MSNGQNAEEIKKLKRKFCSIEKEYGSLYANYLNKWNWWRDKVFERTRNLNRLEVRYDLEVNYEQMPKYKAIVNILENMEKEFTQSELYQDLYQPYAFKKLKVSKSKSKSKPKDMEERIQKELDKIQKETKEIKDNQQIWHERKEINKNVVILVKNYKQYIDLLRFLYQYFVKKDGGLGFYDDRLRLHLNSHKEYSKREATLDINNPLYEGIG